MKSLTRGATVREMAGPRWPPVGTKAERLRKCAITAYWAASTPLEAKMAGILLDLFAPDVACASDGVPYSPIARPILVRPPARYRATA